VRTVYVGTSAFAAAVLARLAASPHRPTLVVTRPDRPRGRGRRVAGPPVAATAAELGIEVDQPASINDVQARERIAAQRPDTVCVCAFGALISEPLLSEHRMRNVHPSLLPRWRGAAPIERAIMAGDPLTGVSIMALTAGLDSGPVCLQEREPIRDDDTYGSLAPRLQKLGGELLVRTLDESPQCTAQDDALATYAEKIAATDRALDPALPADELARVVRALTPHIGAHVTLADGTMLGVLEARVHAGKDPPAGGGPPAGVVSLDGPLPLVGCAVGSLELVTVQPPGRRPMSGEDFLRGLRGGGKRR
jgi:methionyl-tRNA formyltransferase